MSGDIGASRTERLSRVDLFVFSSPVILFQAIELAWRTYLPAFFATTLALPIAAVGMLLLAARLFDGLIDPCIGWASDRFPTRFGLRRPWMALGAPLVGLGALGLFWAVPGTGIATLAAWSLVFHLGYTLIATPHGGWGLELSRDAHERVRVMGAKVWVAMAGMIVTLVLPSLLERGFGLGRAAQVGALGAAIVLLAPITVALVLRRIREPDAPAIARVASPFALFAGMLRTREMRRILMLYGLVGMADAAAAGTFLFFVEQALALPGWGSTLMLVQGVVPLVLLPFWARMSRRFGKRRVLLAGYGWQALVAPLALLLPMGGLAALVLWLIARSLVFGVDPLCALQRHAPAGHGAGRGRGAGGARLGRLRAGRARAGRCPAGGARRLCAAANGRGAGRLHPAVPRRRSACGGAARRSAGGLIPDKKGPPHRTMRRPRSGRGGDQSFRRAPNRMVRPK